MNLYKHGMDKLTWTGAILEEASGKIHIRHLSLPFLFNTVQLFKQGQDAYNSLSNKFTKY